MSSHKDKHLQDPPPKAAPRFKVNPIEIAILAGFVGTFAFLMSHFAKEYDNLQLSAYQSTPLRGNLTYNEKTLGRAPSSLKTPTATCERGDHVCNKKSKLTD